MKRPAAGRRCAAGNQPIMHEARRVPSFTPIVETHHAIDIPQRASAKCVGDILRRCADGRAEAAAPGGKQRKDRFPEALALPPSSASRLDTVEAAAFLSIALLRPLARPGVNRSLAPSRCAISTAAWLEPQSITTTSLTQSRTHSIVRPIPSASLFAMIRQETGRFRNWSSGIRG